MTKYPSQKRIWDPHHTFHFRYRDKYGLLTNGRIKLSMIYKFGMIHEPVYGKKKRTEGKIVGSIRVGYIITKNYKKYGGIYANHITNLRKTLKTFAKYRGLKKQEKIITTHTGTVIRKIDIEYIVKSRQDDKFMTVIRKVSKIKKVKKKRVRNPNPRPYNKNPDTWEDTKARRLKTRMENLTKKKQNEQNNKSEKREENSSGDS